jgi:hypothetical protein
MMNKIERDVDTIGDTTREMLTEVKDSAVFNFLSFRKVKAKGHR